MRAQRSCSSPGPAAQPASRRSTSSVLAVLAACNRAWDTSDLILPRRPAEPGGITGTVTAVILPSLRQAGHNHSPPGRKGTPLTKHTNQVAPPSTARRIAEVAG